MIWFLKKKEKKKEEEEKFNYVKFEIEFGVEGIRKIWNGEGHLGLKKPITRKQFTEEFKQQNTKEIKAKFASGELKLLPSNSYIKNYSFKKVTHYGIFIQDLVKDEEVEPAKRK